MLAYYSNKKEYIEMKKQIKLDRIDIKILELIQEDARISNIDLARQVGLSPSPCHRRMKIIEDAGLVKQYVTLLDRVAVGLELTAFVEVGLAHKDANIIAEFQKAVLDLPEIMECHVMTGESDYMLRIVAQDIESFRSLVMNKILSMPGVDRTRTNISLGEFKYTTSLPLSINSD
jgi:DNA-binding Lrp family transcriptional regulator